ncbi:hypothetical protein LXL04_026043 [Taraxacum kok-saghyz]
MSSTGPNSNAIPPDLKNYDRNRFLRPNSVFDSNYEHRGTVPAPADERSHPPLSSGTGKHTMGTATRNLQIPDRDLFFSPISEIGELSDHHGFEPANSVAIPLPVQSPNTTDQTMEFIDQVLNEPETNFCSVNRKLEFRLDSDTDGFADYHDSILLTDAPKPLNQCPIDNTQDELKNSMLNSARTEPGLRYSSDKIHHEVASSDPLNIVNPVPMKAIQNSRKRNKICSNWMKLDLKQKVRLVNNLGASKTQMALKKSIWIKRVKNLARKKHLNLDNIQQPNKTINPDVEKPSEAEENHLKETSIGTIDKKNTENNIVANKEKREEGKTVVQAPMSYADKVGKKRQMANMFSVIKKDPKLKVGEVEMPMADILKGSEPYSTTIYGYFIEKRVNYFNMNKYALSKWKQFGIEEVMVVTPPTKDLRKSRGVQLILSITIIDYNQTVYITIHHTRVFRNYYIANCVERKTRLLLIESST